ncbi:MAG: hypothetical protein C0475_01275 [Planctomyces sp.]|nr:hypothetical protein [Planctomyces sp.]MBA4039779.1 hypothetical protein [Planctomyces sp.]MBA4119217.1 hypothetical protein [Isosphaera sp.]
MTDQAHGAHEEAAADAAGTGAADTAATGTASAATAGGGQPAPLVPKSLSTTAGREQRRHERHPCYYKVAMYDLDDRGNLGAGCDAEAIDISRAALGVRSRRMFHQGRLVAVIMLQQGRPVRCLFGKVEYSEYESRGNYRVAVSFCQMPYEREVLAALREKRGWEYQVVQPGER